MTRCRYQKVPSIHFEVKSPTDCLALVDDREAVLTDVARHGALFLLGRGDGRDGVVRLLYPLHRASHKLYSKKRPNSTENEVVNGGFIRALS